MRVSTVGLQKRSLDAIINMQAKVSYTQQQISTGKEYLHAHEAPIKASRSTALQQYISQLGIYEQNGQTAENRLSLTESTLSSVLDMLEDVNVLNKKALNGTLRNEDRQVVADAMQGKLDAIKNLANTKDDKGEYLFSGYQSFVQPFTEQNGSIVYNGDDGQRGIALSPSTEIPLTESGAKIFTNIPDGNGHIISHRGATPNLGSGVISNGVVVDLASYVEDDYTINFVLNGSSELAYTVTGAASGQVIPALPDVIPADAPAFQEDMTINFNGISFDITGQPLVGDSFEIQPSQSQSVFTTIENMIDALRSNPSTPAEQADYQMDMLSDGLSLAKAQENVLRYTTSLGARAATIDNEMMINKELQIQNEKNLGDIQDVDFSRAISDLTVQLSALEAAQQSYLQIHELSLFNFLR